MPYLIICESESEVISWTKLSKKCSLSVWLCTWTLVPVDWMHTWHTCNYTPIISTPCMYRIKYCSYFFLSLENNIARISICAKPNMFTHPKYCSLLNIPYATYLHSTNKWMKVIWVLDSIINKLFNSYLSWALWLHIHFWLVHI